MDSISCMETIQRLVLSCVVFKQFLQFLKGTFYAAEEFALKHLCYYSLLQNQTEKIKKQEQIRTCLELKSIAFFCIFKSLNGNVKIGHQ